MYKDLAGRQISKRAEMLLILNMKLYGYSCLKYSNIIRWGEPQTLGELHLLINQ